MTPARGSLSRTAVATVVVLALGIALTLGTGVAGASSHDNCTTVSGAMLIDQSGCYVLDADLTASSDPIIEIDANDVVFNGHGHELGGGDPAIHVLPGVSNVTVRNVTVYSSYEGVYVEQATDVTIEDVTTRNNYKGILLEYASDITIRNVDHQYDEDYGILAEDSTNVSVEGVTSSLSGGEGFGSKVIYFDSTNGSITDVELTAGEYGLPLELYNSHGTVLENVTVTATDDEYALYVDDSPDVIIRDSSVNGYPDVDAVRIDDSPNARLMNISITGGELGLDLSAANVTMRDVAINETKWGLYISSHFRHDIDQSNTVDGLPVYIYENLEGQTFDGSVDRGYFAIVDSSDITLTGVERNETGQGFVAAHVDGLSIESSKFTNNSHGISIVNSTEVSIADTNVSDSRYGIYLGETPGTTVDSLTAIELTDWAGTRQALRVFDSPDLTVTDGTYDGMLVWVVDSNRLSVRDSSFTSARVRTYGSSDSIISNNSFIDGGAAISIGDFSRRVTIVNNTLDGMFSTGILVSGHSDEAVVRDNIVRNVYETTSNTGNGILIGSSSEVLVSKNTVDGAEGAGIMLNEGSGTIVESNEVTNAGSGFGISRNGNDPTSEFVVRNNTFEDVSIGISLYKEAQDGRVERNLIVNTSSYGLYLPRGYYSGVSTNVTISDNEFNPASTTGLHLVGGQEYTIANNTLTGGEIIIDGGMAFDVANNTIVAGGITLDSVTNTDLRSNFLESSSDGIRLKNVDANSSVRENRILNATRYGIWGDPSEGTSEGAITGNEVRWSGGIGIHTSSAYDGTLIIADNIVVGGEDVGVDIGDNGVILRNNTIADNEGGIEISGNAVAEAGEGTVVTANHVIGSYNESGIVVRRGDTGVIKDNVLDDNRFGITLISTHDFTVTNNTVSNSTVGLWLGRTFSDIQQRADGGYRYSWFRETADNRIVDNSFDDVVQGVHVSISPDAILTEEEGLSIRTETTVGVTGISATISVEEGDEDIVTDVVDGPSVTNNTVYNNRFVADDVFVQSDGFDSVSQSLYDPVLSPNTWNVTKTAGENIVGGPYFGGNYWSTFNGTGFSDTCVDGNSDGLCDDSYVLTGPNNTDALPLADPPADTDIDDGSDDGTNETDTDVGSDDGTDEIDDGDGGFIRVTDNVTVNSITVANGTDSGETPYVEAWVDDQPMLQLNLRSSEFGEYDLDSLGFDTTTEFEIDLTVRNFEPRLLLGAGNVTSWERTPNGTDGTDITLRVRPIPTQALFECDGNGTCTTPDLNNWPSDANDTATDQTNLTVSMAVDDLSGYDSGQQTLLDGTIIGTDAQLFGDPTYRAATGSQPAQLALLVGAPHFTVDGAQNTGFYDAFLPAALLANWGVTDPGQLSAAYRGSTTGFEATNVSGGMTIHVPLHYSAGEVAVSATHDTEPPTVNITDLTGSRTDGQTVYVNDTLAIEATANGTPGQADSVSFVLDSLSTSFRQTTAATRNETTGNWTATVDLNEITDDGRYTLKAVAVDAAGNTNTTTAAQTIVVDRKQPRLGTTVTRVDSTNGRANVTATEALQGATVDVTVEHPDGQTESVTMTADGTRRWTGTFPMSSDGRYNVSTTALDQAGNRGTDTAYASASTVSTADRTITLKFDPSDMFIRFNTSADINSFVTVTTSDSPLAPLSPGVSGAGFLNGQLGEALDANLSNATIGVPADGSNLPTGLTTDDYQLGYYNESADEWEFLPTEIRAVTLPDGTTDTYWITQIDHFSTYGVVNNDTDAPTITGTTPSQNHEFAAGTTDATLKLTYEDSLSGVNASAVIVQFNGQDMTSADSTRITSREIAFEASGLTNDSTYDLDVTVVDEAGNKMTETLSVSVAAASTPTTTESTPTSSSSSRGSSRGSTRTPPPSVTVTPTNERFEVAITDAKANTPVEINFGESALDARGSGIETLQLTLGVDRAFDLSVSRSEGPEVDGPSLPETIGRSISYLRLDHPELSDEEITEASFRFRVDADTLAERNATPTDVVLYRYHDSEWAALETTPVESTASVHVFEADSPGLSTFTIATPPSKTADEDTSGTADEDTSGTADEDTSGTADEDGTPTEERDGGETSRIVLLVLVALIAVLAIGGYLRTRR